MMGVALISLGLAGLGLGGRPVAGLIATAPLDAPGFRVW